MRIGRGLETVFGSRPLTKEEREKIALKTTQSCVAITSFPVGPSHSVVELFDGMFGVAFPDDLSAEIRLVSPAIGSGFIVDDRHIVTNSHVVADERAEVHFVAQAMPNRMVKRQTLRAKVVARDVVSDLAVLRVEGLMPFPPLKLNGSHRMRIGERVIAMKNWRLNRYVGSSARIEDLGAISSTTDARTVHNVLKVRSGLVQKGDSGSPVVDERGRVVGVMRSVDVADNTAGYAVPINLAERLLKEAREA